MSARALLQASVLALILAPTCSANAAGPGRDARKAAATLVAGMHPAKVRADGCTFAASKVVSRRHRFWLAVGSTCYPKDEIRTRMRMFRWSGRAWRQDGTVTGPLGPSQWLDGASLTGSRAPDFAIQGCGAGDTNCLSIVSRVGGRWHAIPFVYGYGTSLEVNGVVAGHLVSTVVNACGCAGGPTTGTYERYSHGRFVPTDPPGRKLSCGASVLAGIAYPWYVRVLRFTRVGCAGGWALAVGDGAGSSGPVVALFDSGFNGPGWHLLTIDEGNALPTAPQIYDLPLSLLERIAAPAGPTLAPQIAAARLIGRLQEQYDFYWAQQNGIVEAGGERWLIAVVPVAPPPNDYSPAPVGAIMYRWDGTQWVEDGRIARLSHNLNANWFGGWFVSVPRPQPSTVAFELVESCCTRHITSHAHSTGFITNAGGTWHVEPFPKPDG